MSIHLTSMLVFLVTFAASGGIGLLVLFWAQRDRHRAIARLRRLGNDDVAPAKEDEPRPMLGQVLPSAGKLLLPQREERAGHWKRRLQQAGYRGPTALLIFLGIKVVLLIVLPALALLVPWGVDLLPLDQTLAAGVLALALAYLGPDCWLRWRIGVRRQALRRNMPDALDMMVLCLEGGVSLPLTIQRVADELQVIFPALGLEMSMVQREIDLGLAPGEAFERFGERCDLDEARGLGSILVQAERLGSGIARSLRLHADAWRQERQQRAEEQARQAAVLILFPMLFCIFPAIFIVTLAPASFQIAQLFAQ